MKCASCGLPLSPTHTPTNCPRCGTPTGAASATSQPQYQHAYWEPAGVVDAGRTPPPNYEWTQNVQMSAAVDPNTLQQSQLTTTFKTNQQIYVSFQIHPNGHAGAVCIIWYLNSKQITNFSLPASATSKYSYAYSIYGGSGPAYVE